ncbi:MAG: glycosyltransferase [Chitinophagaceae bacterium]|nr:MAG: glycosyltransferase [Chitinophagaceae bacterium]
MIIVHIVEPFAGGIAVFVKSLAESMPDDLHIVVHGERKEEIPADMVKKNFPRGNVRFIRWRSAQRSINIPKDFLAFFELFKILRRLKAKEMIDAVHLHSSKSGLLGRMACRMVGIKNVFYTPNGASFLSASNKVSRFIYRQLEKLGNRFGGNVVCCSPSELQHYLDMGIKADYINNGINVKERPERRLKLRDGKFRIVTSGRIEKQKNPALFNTIAGYFQDVPGIEFIWIGDGSSKHNFTSKNITVTGWLDKSGVHDYVAASHIYLSTSDYEGMSFAALEALALKKPVLLSECTGNIDLVKTGLNGDLFRNASEAIIKIMQYQNNPEMLDIMGKYSAEICRDEFDMAENFKSYRELYAGSILTAGSNRAKWTLA